MSYQNNLKSPMIKMIRNRNNHKLPIKETIGDLSNHSSPIKEMISDLNNQRPPIKEMINDLNNQRPPIKEMINDLSNQKPPIKEMKNFQVIIVFRLKELTVLRAFREIKSKMSSNVKKKLQPILMPAHTANNPRVTLAIMYTMERSVCPDCNNCTFSNANAENVVYPPQKPVTSNKGSC